MKPGDILLFRNEQDWMARIVAWATNSLYNHVAVFYSAEKRQIIDSMPGGGVRFRGLEEMKVSYDVFRVKAEYTYDLEGTLSFLKSKKGAGYDIPGVIGLGFLKFLAKLKIPLKNTANRWQKKKDYFCSELCYEAFEEGGGLDIVPDVPDGDITSPGDIARSKVLEKVIEEGKK